MKIKNWKKFQHFKDRRPPWIKLYRDILDDVEWHELDAQSAKILVMLWLIASEDENGYLPTLKTLAFRLRLSETSIKSTLSKLSHWLDHDDITAISSEYRDDLPETERETETETKKETKTEKKERATRLQDNWQPSDAMIQFCKTERPDLQWQFIADGFRDYWIAQAGAKGRKVDWEATWRNWIRNQRRQPGTYENAKEKSRRETYEVLTGKRKADDAIIDLN
jgi:hypothetical protein